MLLFTPEQELAVNGARAAFNMNETALASTMAALGAPMLVGNSAPIPIDAWRRIDQRSTRIFRDVLAVYSRLAAANTTPLGVGDIMSYFAQMSDSGEVSVSLDGRHTGKSDQAIVKMSGTPVPVITSEARFGWRQMEVMRKAGMQVDAETIANHQRKVAEKLEDMALNGDTSVVINGSTVYGLRTLPQRNTDTHGFDLNNAATTGANWMTAVTKVINALQGDNAFGPVTLFLNYADYTFASLTDFKANGDSSILDRILSQEMVREVIPCSRMPADNIVGIANLDSGEWGSILSAMPPTTAPKMRANTRDDYVFEVIAMTAPQLRTDFDGKCPIAHVTAA